MDRDNHILFTGAGASSPTELAGWEDVVQEGVELDDAVDVQVVRFFRGDRAVVYDRRNELVTLSFIVIQEWDSLAQAFEKFMGARAAAPRSGTLAWTARGGSASVTRYLVGCALRVRPLRRLGVATYIQYTAVGGEITQTPPTT